MTSSHATFVCKECKEVIHYDFNQKVNEEEWKSLQAMGVPCNVGADREKVLEQSFVMISDNWDRVQTLHRHPSSSAVQVDQDKLSKRRTLHHTNALRRPNTTVASASSLHDSNPMSKDVDAKPASSSSASASYKGGGGAPKLGTPPAASTASALTAKSVPIAASNLSPASTAADKSHAHAQSANALHHASGDGGVVDGSSSSSAGANMVGDDFAQNLNVLQQILEISAGHAQVEHPLCCDCTGKIMRELDSQVAELTDEKKSLTEFLHANAPNANATPPDNAHKKHASKQTQKQQQQLQKQYAEETHALQAQLASLAQDKERLKMEYEHLELEAQRMNEYEQMFFCDANDFWYSIENLSMQHAAVRQKIRQVSSHLDVMKRTNVFDDAFHIYHDGHFGTINGLRLGRLPSVSVEWEEINTGLGQCVLLLDVLAQRCKAKNFKFKTYELYPMGSFSYIKEKKKNSSSSNAHNMYGSTGLFGYKQCDKALECFLQCIKQFADWMTAQDQKFALRYHINGHLIGDRKKLVSIRFAQSTEENWTQALKYMVIDLKYLLAWVARYSP